MKTKKRPAAYFDTSVLAKGYLHERGSLRARQLDRSLQVITSEIAVVEITSALRRKFAAHHMNESIYATVRARARRDQTKVQFVHVTSEILAAAEEYVSALNVRTLDAIHLATAIHTNKRFGKTMQFATADAIQRDAAEALGLEIIWVE